MGSTYARKETAAAAAERLERKRALLHTVDELAQAVADGVTDPRIDAFLAWLRHLHRYSFRNALLIALQWDARRRADPALPELSHVGSYRAWSRVGRQVRRGEHGLALLVPVSVRLTDQSTMRPREPDPLDPDGRTARLLRFKVGHVFDVSQTEGDPIPSWATPYPDAVDIIPDLVAVADARGTAVTWGDTGKALGYSEPGRIVLSAAVDPAATVSTLLHELAHDLLHQPLPNTDPGPAAAPLPPAVMELEAEAVAATVLGALGLDAIAPAAHYIRNAGGNAAMVRERLHRITHAAQAILGAILPDPLADAEDTCALYT